MLLPQTLNLNTVVVAAWRKKSEVIACAYIDAWLPFLSTTQPDIIPC